MAKNKDIAAIIITYFPNFEKLTQLIDAVTLQVNDCIIIDNTENIEIALKIKSHAFSKSINYKWLEKNIGLAAAQNIGIRWADSHDKEYILTLDQDSLPNKNMINEQVNVLNILKNNNYKISSIGPVVFQQSNNQALPLIKFNGLSVSRLYYKNEIKKNKIFEPVTFLPSSGCLIPMDSLKAIGYMDENLFIDYIDIEWQLRANNFRVPMLLLIQCKNDA